MTTKVALAMGAGGILLLAGLLAPIVSRMPTAQAARVVGTGVVGIDAGGSFRRSFPRRRVHGHFDHTAGLRQFPAAVVYTGPGEGPLVRGEPASVGWMARMSAAMMAPEPFSPPRLTEFTDGELLEIDGSSFRAIHTPGHTEGAAMYIHDGVLVTGDTIVGPGDRVNEIPRPTYTNYDAVRGSVEKVMAYPFDRIAGGHVSLHAAARSQVAAYLAD